MREQEEVLYYPAWREGLRRFLAEGFGEGAEIKHEWFYEAFSLVMPEPDTPLREAERTKLQFLGAFEELRSELLEHHQVALASIRGFGYRVMPAAEQTRWAETEGVEGVRHCLRKMGDRLSNVNLTGLDGQQRKDNADALARLAMMTGMLKRARQLN